LRRRKDYEYRDWALDSGAFTAYNSGIPIDLGEYKDRCGEMLASDPTLTEVFALDVIGDWKASLRNTERMWKSGVKAVPCFHYGEPWDVLKGLAREYPKVALGGSVGKRDKDKWAEQCFARVWPCKLHGFGFGSEKAVLALPGHSVALPWHSVDSTTWEIHTCRYGEWYAFQNTPLRVKGNDQPLRVEVEWYQELERRAREQWRVRGIYHGEAPTVRLAVVPDSGGGRRMLEAFGKRGRIKGTS
jgi:hypothetical protein